MLHTAEALAEDQSRRSGSTSEDWGWRGGTGGGPGPMDIEEARRRSHELTAMRPRREVLAGARAARLDCVEAGDSRRTWPT